MLRKILRIRWDPNNNWITNEQLYEETKLEPWSKVIEKRRLRHFGHVCRLPEKAPSKRALYEALRPCKNPRGGQKLTLIRLINKELTQKGTNIRNSIQTAQDRKVWRSLVSVGKV